MLNVIPGLVSYGFFAVFYIFLDIMCIRFVEDNLWRHLSDGGLIKILLYAFAPFFVALHLLTITARYMHSKIFGSGR
jgi:hydrogenase-4 membrane subunit HyfE